MVQLSGNVESEQPIVDFSKLSKNSKEITEADLSAVADRVRTVFGKYGYCLLINHGIPEELVSTIRFFYLSQATLFDPNLVRIPLRRILSRQISAVMQNSENFFHLSNEIKDTYVKKGTYYGYYRPGDKL